MPPSSVETFDPRSSLLDAFRAARSAVGPPLSLKKKISVFVQDRQFCSLSTTRPIASSMASTIPQSLGRIESSTDANFCKRWSVAFIGV